MNKKSILIMIHCAENTGYAIASLEHVFLTAAKQAGFLDDQIFISYKTTFTKNDPQIIECDYLDKKSCLSLIPLIKSHNIVTVLAFDLGFPCPLIPVLKSAGVKSIISYWGASMSSINSGIKLKIKKLECLITKNKPDIFIFESEAMRRTATYGRGIAEGATDVIHLGVDTDKFYANYNHERYTYDTLCIPDNRKIIFYSGHMEERKGVRVIIQAAIYLVDELDISNVHFVICGNKNKEADAYEQLLESKAAKKHVTFAGYRSDIPELMRGSHVGVIASTGWDSFTMSSIEMMASGLPLIVSNLQGLSETIEHEKNGFLITPGDYQELAHRINIIVFRPELAREFSLASELRAKKLFSLNKQIVSFSALIKQNS
ncbi:MAG: glycosyltransferase family 4 protein [Pseudomonadota bacterium]